MVDERAFTASLAHFFGSARDVEVGIGDDAAVVKNRGAESVLCCDPVVEGVHFASDAPPQLVGRKAVNRNLSDLAAMAAVPDWLLVSLVLPHGYAPRRRRALLEGLRAAARAGGCTVVGGDVATSDGPLVVTVTAIGHLAGRALLRSTARVGDTLHVTGPLGGSSRGHHLRFRPALREGVWLAQQRAVHAAIDVSDGLLLDLYTLLQASGGLGAELDAEAVPIRAAARALAKGDRAAALQHALGDGEDHVLLWTQAAGSTLPAGGPLTKLARRPIGRVVAGSGLWLATDGRRERVAPVGFRHGFAAPHLAPAR
ncbi:MAG: thiamine-phosphate kinase [Planctomycetota bacterium]